MEEPQNILDYEAGYMVPSVCQVAYWKIEMYWYGLRNVERNRLNASIFDIKTTKLAEILTTIVEMI